MTTPPLRSVPAVPDPAAALRRATIEWADNASQLASSLARGLRSDATAQELAVAIAEAGRAHLALTEKLVVAEQAARFG